MYSSSEAKAYNKGSTKSCYRGCSGDWDIRQCCEHDCPKKNTNRQFRYCPMKLSTIGFILTNDQGLNELVQNKEWNIIKQNYKLSRSELKELREEYENDNEGFAYNTDCEESQEEESESDEYSDFREDEESDEEESDEEEQKLVKDMNSKFIIPNFYEQSSFDQMEGWDKDKVQKFKDYLTKCICSNDEIREYVEEVLENFIQEDESDNEESDNEESEEKKEIDDSDGADLGKVYTVGYVQDIVHCFTKYGIYEVDEEWLKTHAHLWEDVEEEKEIKSDETDGSTLGKVYTVGFIQGMVHCFTKYGIYSVDDEWLKTHAHLWEDEDDEDEE
jgi:hypothetical protein